MSFYTVLRSNARVRAAVCSPALLVINSSSERSVGALEESFLEPIWPQQPSRWLQTSFQENFLFLLQRMQLVLQRMQWTLQRMQLTDHHCHRIFGCTHTGRAEAIFFCAVLVVCPTVEHSRLLGSGCLSFKEDYSDRSSLLGAPPWTGSVL